MRSSPLLVQVPSLFFRALNTDEVAYHAQHTRLFERALREEFEAVIPPHKMDTRWLPTNMDVATKTPPCTFDAEFLVDNVCNPVYFQSAVQALPPNTLVIEVGPSSSLLGLVKRTRAHRATSHRAHVPLLRSKPLAAPLAPFKALAAPLAYIPPLLVLSEGLRAIPPCTRRSLTT
jgi:acyl transferase domain-containing protein